MQKVTGIGGVFFRARDPIALSHWYDKHLGINGISEDAQVWTQQPGLTVFAPFPHDTDYFGSEKQGFMLNFRVNDLSAMLGQLGEAGIAQVGETLDQPGLGRFAWINDPEGNRIELWQPEIDPAK
jgi:glyoxylase I family protein